MTDFPQIHNTELAGSRFPATDDFIKSRIFTVRGLQVVVDRDLAELYGVQTKVLNQAVKRNANRFPPEFMFVLAKDETEELVTNCDRFASMKHSSVPMRAFSEHGVIMVASVLKSDIAAQISVRITRVFVAMRKALASIAPILMRIDNVEQRQIADRTRNEENQRRNEERFDTIFRAMDGGDFPPQKVFFEGRHYDAYSFAKKLVRKAAKKIVLVDGYSDEVTLDILSQKKGGVAVLVATSQKMIDKHLTSVSVEKFNKQNPTLTVKAVGTFHDRFLILDDKELYHFGASLKDLGRQYCAVSKMDAMFIPSILERI
ncbi:MAG: ORF6N domain-containing protein [Kiritimatiellae bacterium]|nr:ORF6N domain-containing protein [Kiritimatiellia bacterium]